MKVAQFFRRLVAGCAAVVLVFGLAACGSNREETPSYERELDLTTLYGDPVDYYGGWNAVATAGDLQLEFNSYTMAVRLSNTRTGTVWASNPEEPDSDPVADLAAVELLKSQIYLTYHDDANNIGTMNSFTDAVELDQVTTYGVENGLAVHYVLGDTSRDETDVPNKISDTRFQEAVLSKLSEEEVTEMTDFYRFYESEGFWIMRATSIEYIDRVLELFDKAGYTTDDLIKDNAEFGVETVITQRWQFEVTVVYRLEEDGLVVDVPLENLRFPAEAPIYQLRVLENLVSAPVDAEGYLFVPDGSGALMRFDASVTDRNVLSLPIYGANAAVHSEATHLVAEQASMPVYGVKRGDSALLAIIEEGDANATVSAYRANRNNALNTAYTQFDICTVDYVHIAGSDAKSTVPVYNLENLTGSCRLRFRMLEGEEADYVGMAASYQQYLLERDALPERNGAAVPLVVDTIGGVYGYKSFLGLSYVGLKAATTFEESQKILEALQAEGVENVALKLSGWFNDGYAHRYPDAVSVDKELGGKSGLKALLAYCAQRGIGVYPDADLLQVYSNGSGFTPSFDAAKYLDATEVKLYNLSAVDATVKAPERVKPNYRYLLSPIRFAEVFTGFRKGMDKLGLTGVSLRSSGTLLYGDYDDDDMFERNNVQTALCEQLAGLSEQADLLFNGANAYTWQYATVINGAPVDYSYYELEDEAVPFYQLVTSGHIPQTGALLNRADDLRRQVLRCVEYGVGLQVQVTWQPSSFLKATEYDRLYRSHYADLLPEITEGYAMVKDVLDAVAGSAMTDHGQVAEQVYKTVYANGVTVYVNYGDADYVAEGLSVPAQGYITAAN